MDNASNMQNMGEEIINAVTVIYGLFKISNNKNTEHQKIVEEQVRSIVTAINQNIFYIKQPGPE